MYRHDRILGEVGGQIRARTWTAGGPRAAVPAKDETCSIGCGPKRRTNSPPSPSTPSVPVHSIPRAFTTLEVDHSPEQRFSHAGNGGRVLGWLLTDCMRTASCFTLRHTASHLCRVRHTASRSSCGTACSGARRQALFQFIGLM